MCSVLCIGTDILDIYNCKPNSAVTPPHLVHNIANILNASYCAANALRNVYHYYTKMF